MNSKNEVLIWKTCIREARKLFSHSVTAAPLDLIPLVWWKASAHRASLSASLTDFSIPSKQTNLWHYRIFWVKRPLSPACGKPHAAWQWGSKKKKAERSRKSIPKSITSEGELKICFRAALFCSWVTADWNTQ